MQTNLITALREQDNYTYTENGALTHRTSNSACVDFFFQAPTAEVSKAMSLFRQAYIENPELAVRLAFWIRSPRQGAGMRDIGRAAFNFIAESNDCITNQQAFTAAIGNLGRWDDLISLFDSNYSVAAMYSWGQALIDQNQLAAKWAPRERSSNKKAAKMFAKFLNLKPKEYRIAIASLSKTVEQDMCSGQWSNINFSHVPSQAMRKLSNAFTKHQETRFCDWLRDVEEGKQSINASTLWPHQILGDNILNNWGSWGGSAIKELDQTNTQLWNNLPNWVSDTPTICVADTSGSMSGLPIQVSISLGIYTAERLTGIWKDNLITFSREARFVHLDPKLTLAQKVAKIPSIVENTNLQSVFDLILKAAKKHKLSQKDMPQQILIISDMQFDCATEGNTNFQEIEKKFSFYGLKRPNIVFWNVNAKYSSTSPVTYREEGTALVGGYSPSILAALSSGDMNPETTMMRALAPFPFCF